MIGTAASASVTMSFDSVGAPGSPVLVVDSDHMGENEAAWAASAPLARTVELRRPDVDRVLVVAPHPDDEVLGAGGLLQALAASGAEVEICAVTDGEAFAGPVPAGAAAHLARVRTAESRLALDRLGLPGCRRDRLRHPDGDVAAHEAEISDYLASRLDPRTLCLAPWRHDGHPDHDATGRAATTASTAAGARLLQYLVWAWHWARPESDDLPWARCRRLRLGPQAAAAKQWATLAFESQTRPFGADRDPILPPLILQRFWRPYEVYVA